MTVQSIVLTDPTSGASVTILPRDGVAAQQLDTAAPARAASEDRAGGRGAYDTTRYHAGGAVSLTMLCYTAADGTPQEAFLDALAPLLDPALRPVLAVTNDAWTAARQVSLRFDSMARPLSDPTSWLVQVSWSAPGAVWEAATPTTAFVQASTGTGGGMTFDPTVGSTFTSAGVVFSPSQGPSPSQVAGAGAIACAWSGRLYGPCTGPKLANDTTGLAIEFLDGLTLGAGEYVDLGPEPWTATRNSVPSDDVAGLLDFTASSWWAMQPGANVIRYYPTSAGGGSQAQLSFRPAWPL